MAPFPDSASLHPGYLVRSIQRMNAQLEENLAVVRHRAFGAASFRLISLKPVDLSKAPAARSLDAAKRNPGMRHDTRARASEAAALVWPTPSGLAYAKWTAASSTTALCRDPFRGNLQLQFEHGAYCFSDAKDAKKSEGSRRADE